MRRKTNTVKIGNITLSSEQPVMIQSMLNTPTMDTEACVEQALRIVNAGGQLVRITAPGVREAENLEHIRRALRERGCLVPLSADIHFTPDAALVAACHVEKVRINPGNFVDKRATFKKLTYTDEEYAAELEMLRKKFTEFLEVCRKNGTAVRIGTNHGSLSDRIMSRYGDTPAGMVESTMEYLRVCKSVGFDNVVISLKSSDCRIMVDAVRLLVREMKRESMQYPLHLGVTEAGEGEDGRIRSAVGIGTLLNEGIGDTIRVSLTEEPEAEIPVARMLARLCDRPRFEASGDILKGNCSRPCIVADLSVMDEWNEEMRERLDLRQEDGSARMLSGVKTPEMIYVERFSDELAELPEETLVVVPAERWQKVRHLHARVRPLYSWTAYMKQTESDPDVPVWVEVDAVEALDAELAERLNKDRDAVLVLSLGAEYHAYREAFRRMRKLGVGNRTLLRVRTEDPDTEKTSLEIAAQVGGLFLDRLPDGLWISAPESSGPAYGMELSRNILQSAGVRRYKAEFISCPGCGRTLFDLQGAVAKVKQAFGHLSTLKIAVMGCVVNGPGEMGDADFGYVGAGNGKVNLYKGHRMVRVAVPEKEAIEALRKLIEES